MPINQGIYYFNYGEGTPLSQHVVLIHGAGGSYLHWPSEIRRLPGYHVMAIDLPGHGKSAGAGEQMIPDYTRSVAKWLLNMGISKAFFIGHSMGGAIAMTLALEHPDIVSGLGLIGTGGKLRVHPELMNRTANPNTFQSAIDVIIQWAFSDHADARLRELAARRMAETRPAVLHGDFLACDEFNIMDRLGEIQKPCVIICGAQDNLTPVNYSQFLEDQIPHARMQIIPDAGHMVMLERPIAVQSVIMDFLNEIHTS